MYTLVILSLTYKEMRKCKKEVVPIQQAVGHIAATSIIPYPPGIPLIFEGEKITENHIEQIVSLKKAGAYFQNDKDLLKNGLEVFKMQ